MGLGAAEVSWVTLVQLDGRENMLWMDGKWFQVTLNTTHGKIAFADETSRDSRLLDHTALKGREIGIVVTSAGLTEIQASGC